MDQGVTHVFAYESLGGPYLGRASYVQDSIYDGTVLLLHIEMAVKNQGYGSRLLRMLHSRFWARYTFVRIFNPAPAAKNFMFDLVFKPGLLRSKKAKCGFVRRAPPSG